MKALLVAIRDDLAERFFAPDLVDNEEVAKRFFEDQIQYNENIKKHPGDYSIWSLGTYDMKEGQIEALKCPTLIERGNNGRTETTLQN